MSKAFVSADQAEHALQRPLPTGRRAVTAQGHAAHRRALQQLVEEELPRLRAAAMRGSPDAQRAFAEAQQRAQTLERRIELSDEAQAPGPAPQRVVLGTEVWLHNEATDTSMGYVIVGPDEIDVARRRISHLSPMGRALLHHAVGERVFVRRPAGLLEVTIVKIAAATLEP